MGLYGERVGLFSLTTASPEEKARVDSQVKILVRPMYSNPPIHGARIAGTILAAPELYKQWESEVEGMATRIISMREKLYNHLTHTLRANLLSAQVTCPASRARTKTESRRRKSSPSD